jgi:hypothetical protein
LGRLVAVLAYIVTNKAVQVPTGKDFQVVKLKTHSAPKIVFDALKSELNTIGQIF